MVWTKLVKNNVSVDIANRDHQRRYAALLHTEILVRELNPPRVAAGPEARGCAASRARRAEGIAPHLRHVFADARSQPEARRRGAGARDCANGHGQLRLVDGATRWPDEQELKRLRAIYAWDQPRAEAREGQPAGQREVLQS